MEKNKKDSSSENENNLESDQEGSEEEEKKDKKLLNKKRSKETKEKKSKNNDVIVGEDEVMFKLDDKKRITVKKFKGKLLIDFREFYNDNGKMKPGKKGIALSQDNWNKLKEFLDQIDESIDNIK